LRGAEKIPKEGMKDGSFGLVSENRIAILLIEDLNLVFAQTTGSAQVEVAGVFISKGAVFNFGALAPVGGLGIVDFTEMIFNHATKGKFKRGEVARFFESVKEGDDRTAIGKV
jgi:hypothetical protein